MHRAKLSTSTAQVESMCAVTSLFRTAIYCSHGLTHNVQRQVVLAGREEVCFSTVGRHQFRECWGPVLCARFLSEDTSLTQLQCNACNVGDAHVHHAPVAFPIGYRRHNEALLSLVHSQPSRSKGAHHVGYLASNLAQSGSSLTCHDATRGVVR